MRNDFGRWLENQLIRRELTKSDFARVIDRSPSRVSEWTSGRRVPDPASCDLIADALHIDLDIVLAQAGHRPLSERVDPDDPAHEIHGLVDQIDWTIPGNVRIVRAMLRELVRETKRLKG